MMVVLAYKFCDTNIVNFLWTLEAIEAFEMYAFKKVQFHTCDFFFWLNRFIDSAICNLYIDTKKYLIDSEENHQFIAINSAIFDIIEATWRTIIKLTIIWILSSLILFKFCSWVLVEFIFGLWNTAEARTHFLSHFQFRFSFAVLLNLTEFSLGKQ